jgi:hypothetical protein
VSGRSHWYFRTDGSESANVAVGYASELTLTKMLFKGLYRRHGWRNAPDPGNLTTIHVFGWLEVLLFKVSGKIEKRHVLSRERLSAG